MEMNQPVSVHDHEAFAAKHMPELGHDVEDTKVYTWKLKNWTKLNKIVRSREFECGGHKWRILLFPFGNTVAAPNSNVSVSVFLDYADPNRTPDGWHACAQFALVTSNPHDPTIYTESHSHHRFTSEQPDWGFIRFSALQNLFSVKEGHTRPTIEGESADITVFVRVLKDPTGVLWHNFVNYDSKKETGYVGMINHGATGYMNTLLQSLYCIRDFRKAVYEIPTEDDRPTESIALALQRVFYNLQTSTRPVDTIELMKSFGWKWLDSQLQHDVYEFHQVLQDNLESKMKDAITKLFVGNMKSFVKCVNVNYEAARTEEFNVIQLHVKGMKNLRDSFRDYVALDTLHGEYQYMAEGYGPQDAKMGIVFQSFPPVLHLRLKRWDYDIQRKTMVMINDRHEFPFEIDLSEFLDETSDKSQSWLYRLHGVIVHSGDLNGGQYFSMIKPDRETQWLKFDDERVTPVTDRQVLEENYGGQVMNSWTQPPQRNQAREMERSTNAYMLVYIRDTAINEVLAPIPQEDIPPHLKRRLDEERLQIEAKKREHLFLTAKIVTDETFQHHQGFDLASFDEKYQPPSELPTFSVLKQETYRVFKGRVASHFNYQDSQFRLWVVVNRQNKTVRPDTCIPENRVTLTMDVIRNNMAARQSDLRLYVDVISHPSKPDLAQGSIMIFLKHFDPSRQSLLGVGKTYVLQTSKVGDLAHCINVRMRWPTGTPLKLYEEVKPGEIELMKPKMTFAQSAIHDGDVICFQGEMSEKETHDLGAQGLFLDPIQFYDFLQNRVLILFRPKNDEPDKNVYPEFELTLSKKMNYDHMAARVANYLKHDPIKLRFTTTHAANGQPKAVVRRFLNENIAEFMSPPLVSPTPTIILYERLNISIVELETSRSFGVMWTGMHNKESSHQLLLPKTSTVDDLADHLAKRVALTPGGTGKIRVFEVSRDGKNQKEFAGSEMIGNIHDPVELYAEEVPTEEIEADDAVKTDSADS
ncbi:cysteine proteinase [Rickenella mellea]|uniref:ubiquitinyl hydrolase 1 n=1 Tax=Rickenella mellea TaxID=50990 RepID=A0A4Y7PJD3_9AGAM|nr:cysteine proteinase [Rickenella mellea]